MRVLQVHGKDVPQGGGAVSMCRLHFGLRKAGVDSRILCRRKTLESSVEIPYSRRLEAFIRRITGRMGLNDIHCISSFKIRKLPAFLEADILNLHCIHGDFFSYLALPWLTESKPMVFTIRDMWPFTGHCTFSYDCDRWKIGCGNCPYPHVPNPIHRDSTHLEWKLKNWIYSRSNITVVTLSTWLTNQVKQSMLSCFPIYQIPNGVDTIAYQPLDRDLCRSLLGIPMDKKVVLFVAVDLKERRKGGDLLVKALEGLPGSVKAETLLLLLGNNGAETIAEAVDVQTVNLGYISGHRAKAIAYSAADLFVFPSRAETFGNVALEAMACGIPIVSFKIGGAFDMVRPGITGYLAEPENAKELSKGLLQLLEDKSLREYMGKQCRRIAVKEYSAETEVQRYIELYQRVLEM